MWYTLVVVVVWCGVAALAVVAGDEVSGSRKNEWPDASEQDI
jgi:hypothetical protein